MEDLCQESLSRRVQSDECGTVFNTAAEVSGLNVQPSPRSPTFCYTQFTPTAVKSTLSCCHVSYMDCVTVGDGGETAHTSKLRFDN